MVSSSVLIGIDVFDPTNDVCVLPATPSSDNLSAMPDGHSLFELRRSVPPMGPRDRGVKWCVLCLESSQFQDSQEF